MNYLATVFLILPTFLIAQSINIGKKIPAPGETTYGDTLYVFDEGKGSFTGGSHAFTPDWSLDDIGVGSFSFGAGNKATGPYSFALGIQNLAQGYSSFAIGFGAKSEEDYSIAMGLGSNTKGAYALAFGEFSRAEGESSTAIGKSARAEGVNALALGSSARAVGLGSAAIGYFSNSEGWYSSSMGRNTKSSAFAEVSIGSYNTIMTPQSNNNWVPEDRLFVIGNGSGLGQTPERSDAMVVLKNGDVSFPDGDFVIGRTNKPKVGEIVSDNFIFYDNEKSAFRGGGLSGTLDWEPDSLGVSSLGYGFNSIAKGSSSIAIGSYSKSRGDYSVSLGSSSQANGDYSITIGRFLTASGNSSTSMGSSSQALGNNSFAIGHFTKSYSYSETVFGRYNTEYTPQSILSWDEDDRLFVVGNGSNAVAKSDALSILKNGNTTLNGNLSLLPSVYGNGDSALYTKSSTSLKTRVILHQKNTEDIFLGDIDGLGGSLRLRADGADRLVMTPSGNVAVKNGDLLTNTSTNDLGQSSRRWNTAWLTNGVNNSSDQRLKKNIVNLNYGLATVLALRPVSYQWKKNSVGTKLGLIAQEVQNVVPEIVHTPEDSEEFMSVNYTELIPVLIKSIQEQQVEIEALKNELKSIHIECKNHAE